MKPKFAVALVDYANTFFQFVMLNLVFLVTCIPVVTIGPALAALYQVTMREARNENGYLVRYYMKCFREMLKQGIVTFLLTGIAGLAFSFSAAFWKEADTAFSMAGMILSYIGLLVLFMVFVYVFPLMARFSNGIRQTIQNAFLIGLTNAKFTIGLLVLYTFEASLIYLFSFVRVFMVIVGFSFFAYLNSLLYVKFFVKYENQAQSR